MIFASNHQSTSAHALSHHVLESNAMVEPRWSSITKGHKESHASSKYQVESRRGSKRCVCVIGSVHLMVTFNMSRRVGAQSISAQSISESTLHSFNRSDSDDQSGAGPDEQS